jgi:metal-sulfur cluster biosynthetic enzyme
MPEPTSDAVRQALRDVIDPEIGMNIVELGLVYEADVVDGHVAVELTMTTPACPLGESIVEESKAAIQRHVPGVRSVRITLVWDPPWQPSMMSDAARKQLGWA